MRRGRCKHVGSAVWCSGAYNSCLAFVGPLTTYACQGCGKVLPFPAANDEPLNYYIREVMGIELRAAQLAIDKSAATARENQGAFEAVFEDPVATKAMGAAVNDIGWHAGWLAYMIRYHDYMLRDLEEDAS